MDVQCTSMAPPNVVERFALDEVEVALVAFEIVFKKSSAGNVMLRADKSMPAAMERHRGKRM